MAARELRYAWFEQLREEKHCQAVAVAHHRNDQAETLLLNLKRGAGIRGLCGMKPRNRYIVRPLLEVSHNDILHYLTLRHLPHVEDSTNQDTSIPRNRIRQLLYRVPPTDIAHIADTARRMQGYNAIVQDYVKNIAPTLVQTEKETIQIHIPTLLQTVAPETLLYELLQPYGFPQTDQIFRCLKHPSGRRFYSNTHLLYKERNHLVVCALESCESASPHIITTIRNIRTKESFPPSEVWNIIADERITTKPLTLRHWKEGDRFCPIGMKGKKRLLSDFFTDMKLSAIEKQKVWILCSGEDIAWVVGYRLDDRFKVTPSTTRVAEIEILNSEALDINTK